MKYLIGTKFGMTQIFQDSGEVIPVTIIQAGPCTVTQIKNADVDGYVAVQVGYGETRNLKKPQVGHLRDLGNFRFMKEFRDDSSNVNVGDVVNVETFEAGDVIKVTGVSKGKGFQGVVKRYNFAGMPATHGTKDQLRMPGSAGATGPAHIFKGKKMPGRTGADQVTVSGLEIVKVDSEKNLLYVKGAVPGHKNGLLYIKGEGELKIVQSAKPQPNTDEKEAVKEAA